MSALLPDSGPLSLPRQAEPTVRDWEEWDVPTSKGSQLAHSAQERITRRKPAARTKESRMTATA